MKRNEDSLRDFWDNIKGVIFTLYPRRGTEREKRERAQAREREKREPEKISEEISENI